MIWIQNNLIISLFLITSLQRYRDDYLHNTGIKYIDNK